MHGLGNDFVVVDARSEGVGGAGPITASLAAAIGDRRRGVGFDQLAVIHADEMADARLVFWNSDGSLSDACGNATRCIARLLMDETGKPALKLRTGRGVLACEDAGNGMVRVNMGQPRLKWSQVPLAREMDTARLPLAGAPAACSMGNPHCTYFTEDAEADALSEIGPATEEDPLFPERTNVQIVQIIDRKRARVRVWERGVGVTLASGSSACAVVVNAARRGLMERQATLMLDGGEIDIDWRDDGVWMTGLTALVCSGVLTRDFLESVT